MLQRQELLNSLPLNQHAAARIAPYDSPLLAAPKTFLFATTYSRAFYNSMKLHHISRLIAHRIAALGSVRLSRLSRGTVCSGPDNIPSPFIASRTAPQIVRHSPCVGATISELFLSFRAARWSSA